MKTQRSLGSSSKTNTFLLCSNDQMERENLVPPQLRCCVGSSNKIFSYLTQIFVLQQVQCSFSGYVSKSQEQTDNGDNSSQPLTEAKLSKRLPNRLEHGAQRAPWSWKNMFGHSGDTKKYFIFIRVKVCGGLRHFLLRWIFMLMTVIYCSSPPVAQIL